MPSPRERVPAYAHELSERAENACARMQKNEQLMKAIAEKGLDSIRTKDEVAGILTEIERFEEAGERDYRVLDIEPALAKRIGVIWTFSGSGTYDEPVKDDRYQQYPWARGMDKARLDYTARLERKITEAVRGERYTVTASPSEPAEVIEKRMAKKRGEVKDAIRESGPYIVYNGAPVENEVVESVLKRPSTAIPSEKVSIIREDREGKPIDSTVDQMKSFRVPEHALQGGKAIALVSHAPHLSRIARMLAVHRPFPEGTEIVLFPLPTVPAGKEEYAAMETEGIFWYSFVQNDAKLEPYPYTLNHGASKPS